MEKQYENIQEFLDSVQEAKLEISWCERRISEAEAECLRISRRTMGAEDGESRQRALWAALTEERARLGALYIEALWQQRAVEDFIRPVSRSHRAILRLRYIEGLRWPEVMAELERIGLPYSERQMFRLHKGALQEAEKLFSRAEQSERT